MIVVGDAIDATDAVTGAAATVDIGNATDFGTLALIVVAGAVIDAIDVMAWPATGKELAVETVAPALITRV